MPTPAPTPVRVVVIDDSATMRDLLTSLLRQDGQIEVVGTGANGEEAVRLVKRLRPHVLTLDIQMPRMNGLEAVRQIMRECPLPIVIVSASQKPHDMDLAFQALRAGALTILSKPGLNDPETSQKLVQTVRLMAGVPVIHHWGRAESQKPAANGSLPSQRPPALPARLQNLDAVRLVGIAASTGGPSTVARVLRDLPPSFPLPILLVQHFSPGFAGGLAEWLDTQTTIRVEIAAHGDTLRPGVLLMAPDDYHLQATAQGIVILSKGPAYKGLRPSANPLFESLAQHYGPAALGIVLTGMGDDGADGLLALRKAGGYTIAQNEESCVVYGMPREAAARQAADEILPVEQIAARLALLAGRGGGGR
ncbi:MAG: chemotaxis-specific protein-glutamate methyltransferase CheB [Chloroflexota bacterium]